MILLGLLAPPISGFSLELPHGGLKRTCHMRVPADLSKPRPLVVLLHGFSWNGREVDEKTGFGALSAQEGFILACPDGLNGGWTQVL